MRQQYAFENYSKQRIVFYFKHTFIQFFVVNTVQKYYKQKYFLQDKDSSTSARKSEVEDCLFILVFKTYTLVFTS